MHLYYVVRYILYYDRLLPAVLDAPRLFASLSQSRSNKSECLFVQKIGSVVSLAGPVLL